MKIVITGSIGHISKPLSKALIANGHEVTIISSNPDRKTEIEALGAEAAIGTFEDAEFLTHTFTGADAVYTMVAAHSYMNKDLDLIGFYKQLGRNYTEAIQKSGVKRVVNLSTFGAHLPAGNGILAGAYHVEQILNTLPETVSITHMRPVSFYYNLYGYVPMIQATGKISVNYGADRMIPWVSPLDIAEAVAEEIQSGFTGRSVRYVASEELTGDETARILGQAIGRPELKWELISSEESLNQLLAVGMNPTIAAGLIEMYGALYSGLLAEDYVKNHPVVMGKIKLAEFAQEFAGAFREN
ncbi:NAD(P)H-binding protein [Dyadobacter sandarakinus]|uniref:NAD(P)H-binding protein n=1 Tax=Dyadobacter sandarakinus TaxID=2747268 RepID=A0ABX7I2B8_9BACT|nr:NAD(P)H-binding protein [Dyadobacter sandarakinus]QRQ99666.1 NAD(P)H-binding protein [Dyadobacter sandarakinus]